MKARWFGFCARCGEGYAPNDEIVPARGGNGWIHASCHSGADDE